MRTYHDSFAAAAGSLGITLPATRPIFSPLSLHPSSIRIHIHCNIVLFKYGEYSLRACGTRATSKHWLSVSISLSFIPSPHATHSLHDLTRKASSISQHISYLSLFTSLAYPDLLSHVHPCLRAISAPGSPSPHAKPLCSLAVVASGCFSDYSRTSSIGSSTLV